MPKNNETVVVTGPRVWRARSLGYGEPTHVRGKKFKIILTQRQFNRVCASYEKDRYAGVVAAQKKKHAEHEAKLAARRAARQAKLDAAKADTAKTTPATTAITQAPQAPQQPTVQSQLSEQIHYNKTLITRIGKLCKAVVPFLLDNNYTKDDVLRLRKAYVEAVV